MITKTGKNTYPIIDKYVDEVIAVSDEFIYQALPEVIFKTKLVVEPSAVIGIAAALSGKLKIERSEKICFVLSGGNIDPEKLVEFIKHKQ